MAVPGTPIHLAGSTPLAAPKAAWNMSASGYANPALFKKPAAAVGLPATFFARPVQERIVAGDNFVPTTRQLTFNGPREDVVSPAQGVWNPQTSQWAAAISYERARPTRIAGTTHTQRSATTFAASATPIVSKSLLDTAPETILFDRGETEAAITPQPEQGLPRTSMGDGSGGGSSSSAKADSQTYSLGQVLQVFTNQQDPVSKQLTAVPFAELTSPEQQAIVQSLYTNPTTLNNGLFRLFYLVADKVEKDVQLNAVAQSNMTLPVHREAHTATADIRNALTNLQDLFSKEPQQEWNLNKLLRTLNSLGAKQAFIDQFLSDPARTPLLLADIPQTKLMEFVVDKVLDASGRERVFALVDQQIAKVVASNSPRLADVTEDKILRGTQRDGQFREPEVAVSPNDTSYRIIESGASGNASDNGAGASPQ